MLSWPQRLAALCVLIAGAAAAHDTWFEPLPARKGGIELALGTGNQFPVQETGIDAQYLVNSGCRAANGNAVRLRPLRNVPQALVLGARPGAQGQPLTCWAQLTPFDIELAPDKIALYLNETNAPPDTRAAWAALQARGLPWKERYVKHARIELGGASAAPVGLGLEAVLESGAGSLRQGQTLVFRVLRDGAPLADLPVELRNARSPVGLWLRTDAEGRVRVQAPLPGRWLLRGTELRLSQERPDTWDSRFVTLAFDVAR